MNSIQDGNVALDIQDVVKIFNDGGIHAVDGITLAVEKGEIFSLLGPNGAGKTTAINILCGLLHPTSGFVKVNGFDVSRQLHRIKPLIGLCPQEPSVFPYLTGQENIELFGHLYGLKSRQVTERTKLLLKNLFLEEHANRLVQKYSGGLVRRVSIAVALVHDPEIAFLDEPTVALDPQARRAVWDFIRDLKNQGKTILLTTHYMEEAEQLSDRVAIIDHGQIIAVDTPAGLKISNNCGSLEDVFIKLTGRQIREEN
nr:ATP-binding cassette domain-containing protein [Candidatus Sigynarchaeota archaeon]